MTRNIEVGTSLIHLRDDGEVISIENRDDEADLESFARMFDAFLKGIGFVGVNAVVFERENNENISSNMY
ncbi:MAG: hypothetical protein PF569_01495 [Candidatus Woesearchaeota archaeon]|nr:hypothetical protein [Candidatus Woesearchaeota archaeon]